MSGTMTSSCFLVRTRRSLSSSCSSQTSVSWPDHLCFPSSPRLSCPSTNAGPLPLESGIRAHLVIQTLYQPARCIHKTPDHPGQLFRALRLAVRRARCSGAGII